MTKHWISVFLLFILAACTSSPDQPLFSSTSTATKKISLVSTATPSRTPRPSVTPTFPPSATPTFDVASAVTRTLAPPASCPTPAKVSVPDLSLSMDDYDLAYTFSPREERILYYLNRGGDSKRLLAKLERTWQREDIFTSNEAVRDLTGDGVPEILIVPSELYIFGCQDNQYKILMSQRSDAITFNSILLQLVGIQDMNLNRIPEIVIAEFGCGGMGAGQCLDVYIYEWDGNKFASLIPEWEGYTGRASLIGGRIKEYLPDVRIQDIDDNGTAELIITGGIPNSWYADYFDFAPWRNQIDTYSWNGRYFTLLKTEYSTPEYRYQAVQDGDRAMQRHEYDKAEAFYQEAISNDKLLGWSPTHKERSKALHQFTWDPSYKGTPTPVVPPDDPQEYPNLAAYAYYRLVLLHIQEENMPEAQTVYKTLQEKFPEGKDGHEVALIARAFWDEYQRSGEVSAACIQAISIAEEHKEVLKFLGSNYHNSTQDMMYESKHICPVE